MQDRNVEFPNRFRMVKVEGTDDIYDVIPAPGEVISEGDTFSKQNMLPDSITALLGLKMGNPQVKDALNVLANIGNVHVWSRSWVVSEEIPEVPPGYTLGEVQENVVLASRKTSISIKGTFYYYFGDSVTVENYGTVNNPPDDAYTFLGRDVSASTVKSGPLFVKGATDYISAGSGYPVANLTSDATKVFYIPAGGALIVTVEPDPDNSAAKICRVVATKYQLVNGYPYTPAVPAGRHTEFLTSTQPAAYPEGTVDGVTTIYLGQLGDKARIEVGSYVGTGKYGASNPNSLTFGFEPSIVFIYARYGTKPNYADLQGYYIKCVETFFRPYDYGTNYEVKDANNGYFIQAAWDNKTLSWWAQNQVNGSGTNASAARQHNSSGVTYNYIAIG